MQTISNLEIEDESTVVVHDARTGRIAHVYHVVTGKGAKHPDRRTLEKNALDYFSRAQPNVKGKMDVLHVKASDFKPDTAFKVDVKKRALVVMGKRKA